MISTVNHYSAYNYFSREARLTQSHASVRRKGEFLPYGYGYFGSNALLCWRNDAIYTGLRSHLLLAMSAYHFCWRSSRNHCRITFVGFDGDRLFRAVHGSWGLHVRRAQTPRDAYPRLNKQNHKPRNVQQAESSLTANTKCQDGAHAYRSLQRGRDLARYLRHVHATRRILDSRHDPAGESATPDASRFGTGVHSATRSGRNLTGPIAVHGLRYANNLVRSSWSSTQTTPGGYYSNPNARVRSRINPYLTIGQERQHFNTLSEPQTYTSRPNCLDAISPGLGDIRSEFSLNVKRGITPTDDLYDSRKVEPNITSTIGRGVTRAGVFGRVQPSSHVCPPSSSKHGGEVAYPGLLLGLQRSRAHWVGASQPHRRRPKAGGGVTFRRGSKAFQSKRYDSGLNAVAAASYSRFVTNPNLGQTDLVVFANPALTPSLVKQARQLGLPTLGLHSALRSGTDTRRRTGNPGLSFGILGNPNNPWLSFNMGVGLLKLNRLASAGIRSKFAVA